MLTLLLFQKAQDLGLHRSSSGWHIPAPEMELRRRIWYVTYLLDRWVSLKLEGRGIKKTTYCYAIFVEKVAAELGRPITIVDGEFDVEPPSVYEVRSCHQKDFSERPFVPDILLQADLDVRRKTPVYSQFRHSLLLGQIFGQVLSGLYSPMSIRSGQRNPSLVHALDERLKEWKCNLPLELLYDSRGSKYPSRNSGKMYTITAVKLTQRQ